MPIKLCKRIRLFLILRVMKLDFGMYDIYQFYNVEVFKLNLIFGTTIMEESVLKFIFYALRRDYVSFWGRLRFQYMKDNELYIMEDANDKS